MLKLKQSISENKSSLVLAFVTLAVGSLYMAFTIAGANTQNANINSPNINLSDEIQKTNVPITPTLAAVESNAPPTPTPTVKSTAVKADSQDQQCADAIRAKTAASNIPVDYDSKASVDSYNQSNRTAYDTWLSAKARLGCKHNLIGPVVAYYYGQTSTPALPPAPVPKKVCDQTAKATLETSYAQALNQEDLRFQQQVNSYAAGYGITPYQASTLFMPEHQSIYTSLRTAYFNGLTAINC